jgi:plasmid stabilization system protein ParE
LWSSIVDSSLWTEPDHVLKIFLTMLALKDADHVYRGTAFNLARRANKTEAEVLDALKVLASPDKTRVEAQPFEGRRIQMCEDGWKILNGEKYRQQVQDEMRKARWRRAQQKRRDKAKGHSHGMPGERSALQHGVTMHEHLNGDRDPGLTERQQEEDDQPL